MSDGPARKPDTSPPSPWFRRVSIGLAVLLGPELVANLLSNIFANTGLGRVLQSHATAVLVTCLGVVAAVLVMVFLMDRRRDDGTGDVPTTRPEPPDQLTGGRDVHARPLPTWHRFPTRIQGRDREIKQALDVVRARGVVAVVGRRDIGTSSVANLVVERLLAEEVPGGPETVVWVDLRGHSSTSPPGPREVAGRLLSTFDLDEPADATPNVLADAAVRLVAAADQLTTVLLLDNVFTADQVTWLTAKWPVTGKPPMLVIAGDEPAAAAVDGASVVTVGELKLPAMRAILSNELGENWLRRIARGVRRDLRVDSDPVDVLLSRFRGLPRAVREIARLLAEEGERSLTVVELIDDTADPAWASEPMVALWRAVLPVLRPDLSHRATELMRALAVLPVTGLTRDALDALLSAVDDTAEGYPDPVEELRRTNVIRESPPGRFRLPEEVRRALRRIEPGPVPERTWAAVTALLRHYATRAGGWAAALRSVTDARSAIVWLHQEEPLLRALLTDWRPDEPPPESLVDDLAVIADALDVWYVRELQSDGLVATGRGLAELAGRAGRPELVRLAHLRVAAAHRIGTHLDMADVEVAAAEPDERTARHPAGHALRARWHNERALIEFDRAGQVRADEPAFTERLQTADHELRVALDLVPDDDPTGRMCVLLNLAAVALEQHRLDRAHEFLAMADVLAGGDLSCAAHMEELNGVAAIVGGNAPEAVVHWQKALALYRDLGEEQGQARCWQHLGTLAVVSPDIAGLLDTGHRFRVGRNRAAAVAHDHLTRARRLLAGQPDTTLVDFYLRIAERRMTS